MMKYVIINKYEANIQDMLTLVFFLVKTCIFNQEKLKKLMLCFYPPQISEQLIDFYSLQSSITLIRSIRQSLLIIS